MLAAAAHKEAVRAFMGIIRGAMEEGGEAEEEDDDGARRRLLTGQSVSSREHSDVRKSVERLPAKLPTNPSFVRANTISVAEFNKLTMWQKYILIARPDLYVLKFNRAQDRAALEVSRDEKVDMFSRYLECVLSTDLNSKRAVQAAKKHVKRVNDMASSVIARKKAKQDVPIGDKQYKQVFANTIWDTANRSIINAVFPKNLKALQTHFKVSDHDFDVRIRRRLLATAEDVKADALAATRPGQSLRNGDQTKNCRDRILHLAKEEKEAPYNQMLSYCAVNYCLLQGIMELVFKTSVPEGASRKPAAPASALPGAADGVLHAPGDGAEDMLGHDDGGWVGGGEAAYDNDGEGAGYDGEGAGYGDAAAYDYDGAPPEHDGRIEGGDASGPETLDLGDDFLGGSDDKDAWGEDLDLW
jgi:hypothetical protein